MWKVRKRKRFHVKRIGVRDLRGHTQPITCCGRVVSSAVDELAEGVSVSQELRWRSA